MIRVQANPLDSEELEEEGFKIGCQGNDSMARVIEGIDELAKKQRLLNLDYDEVQKLEDPTKAFEEILLRQITLEKEKVAVYERGHSEEALLRMRAVRILRKHELKAFGEIHDIAPRSYGSDEPVESLIPKTPERDRTKEELPWYWRSEENALQPRTPIGAVRRYEK